MSDELKIECKWLGRQTGSEVERSFYADIGLAVGDNWLTLLEDFEASTVRNHLRGSAHQLATWFAANWWRLRWEPETPNWRSDPDWRVAHSMAAAGGGFVWPNVVFASDGDFLTVASLPRTLPAEFEPIRYLNRFFCQVGAAEFEQSIDRFLEGILSRLDSRKVGDKSLAELWAEVLLERNDPESAERRKLEAISGFDPDLAPEAFVEQLLETQDCLGKNAVEEVAADARHAVVDVLEPIQGLSRSQVPQEGGFRVTMPSLDVSTTRSNDDRPPWQYAAELARFARQAWGFNGKPIKNKVLADLLGASSDLFTRNSTAGTRIPFAIHKGSNGTSDLYFNSRNTTSRRFSACRMIGDHLYFSNHERLLPATHAKTSRQKFQRAFAQEFLCPIEELRQRLGTSTPDEDDIAEAADHFHVSPLMIRTTLVNKGELDREALGWSD